MTLMTLIDFWSGKAQRQTQMRMVGIKSGCARDYGASFAGSVVLLINTHSLRCGLEECRQLRWLRSTFIYFSALCELRSCSRLIPPALEACGGTANAVPFQNSASPDTTDAVPLQNSASRG